MYIDEKNDVLVSIKCLAYNHGPFIRRALESFVNQETNFRFEVIVHDDASTDNTAVIIREYQERYPEIIKPIYQTENQYFKCDINKEYIYPQIRGKYIAYCEGDDYWIDKNKLQIQIDYLENHPECAFTFHNAEVVWMDGSLRRRTLLPDLMLKRYIWEEKNHMVSMEEIIDLGYIPTASIVARTEYLLNSNNFVDNPVCGDLPQRLSMMLKGNAYYFSRIMSAYRTGNNASASGQSKMSYDKYLATINGQIDILRAFDIETKYKWHSAVEHDINRRLLGAYMTYGDAKAIKNNNLGKMMHKEVSARVLRNYYACKLLGGNYEKIKSIIRKLRH